MTVFSAVDKEGKDWVLGLRDLPSKSAEDTFSVFKEILGDLTEQCKLSGQSGDRGKEILVAITQSMSDRAATEVKLNSLIERYINEVVPMIREAEEILDEEAMGNIRRLDTFFCGLHDLVHFVEAAVESHREFEQSHFEGGKAPILNAACYRAGESGGSRAVQSVCKGFARGGDEKNGCFTEFTTFLRPYLAGTFGTTKNPFSKFLGSRFNVLGRNAVYTYVLCPSILDFLSLRENNLLFRSIAFDLQQPVTVAEVRVLGICSKLIWTPMWNVLEDADANIAHMAAVYTKMLTFLEQNANNPTPILTHELNYREAWGTVIPRGPPPHLEVALLLAPCNI